VTAERQNGSAYAFLAPALVVMTLCGVVPMGFVAYYSLHDTFAGNSFVWVGATWFGEVLTSPEFYGAAARSLGFSLLVLMIQIPLGIYIALRLPSKGLLTSVYIVLMTIPLLTPSIVVGYLWKVLTLPQAGLLFEGMRWLGGALDMNSAVVTWIVLALMDTWHWTSLVVLLCFAGLRAIPDDYYRAASIDGASRWAVFRHIQLPKLRLVLLIAVLLRFMDSFMIYSEAYVVTRGGPGVSTTFLSHELVQTALIQFDLGQGGAMAVIYFVIVLCVSWAFFRLIVPRAPSAASGHAT
jgi:glycerol transport system permease protein